MHLNWILQNPYWENWSIIKILFCLGFELGNSRSRDHSAATSSCVCRYLSRVRYPGECLLIFILVHIVLMSDNVIIKSLNFIEIQSTSELSFSNQSLADFLLYVYDFVNMLVEIVNTESTFLGVCYHFHNKIPPNRLSQKLTPKSWINNLIWQNAVVFCFSSVNTLETLLCITHKSKRHKIILSFIVL